MAAFKKRRVKGSSSSEDIESSDSEQVLQEVINVDFEAYAPDDSDFHGIKNLLNQLFLKEHINTSELTNLLIQQNYITSVIKQTSTEVNMDDDDDENDVNFGVFSVVNLTEKKDLECVKQLHSFIIDHCKENADKSTYEALKSVLNDDKNHLGLIINERFLNIPPKIALPLYESLSADMKKAKEEKQAFDFAYFLIISKLMLFSGREDENIIYANAEEEIIAECAEISFEFSVVNNKDAGLSGKWNEDDAEGQPMRKLLIFPSSNWEIILQKLREELA